jgi:hypothetical protein
MQLQIGAMSVGDILDRGLKVLFRRLPTFYLVNLLTLAPIITLQAAFPEWWLPKPRPDEMLRVLGATLLLLAATVMLQPFAAAATLYVVAREFSGQRAGIGAAFVFALRRFLSLLAASFLFGVIFMAGWAMCCVPGILFAVWFIFVGQAVVVEGRGPIRALGRSMELTEGYRWRVFGVCVLLGIAYYASGAVAGILAAVLPPTEFVRTDRGPDFIVNYQHYYLSLAVQTLGKILVQTFGAVCVTLLYFDLRIRKEGLDLELAARRQASIV